LVTYDDDLIDRITTRVRDSTVIIEVDGSSLGSTGPGRAVSIVMSELVEIDRGSYVTGV